LNAKGERSQMRKWRNVDISHRLVGGGFICRKKLAGQTRIKLIVTSIIQIYRFCLRGFKIYDSKLKILKY